MKTYNKRDFPVEKIRHYLEPGPIVLVSSQWRGKANIMTMGWHTVMEFSPSLVGCVLGSRLCRPGESGPFQQRVCIRIPAHKVAI